jgi:anhydro-N-acetylmuramic acid kinase
MKRYFIGVMSGTSLDGVDVALVCAAANQFEMRAKHFLPYPDPIKTRLLALHEPSQNELEAAQRISNELAHCMLKRFWHCWQSPNCLQVQ